MSTPFRLRMVIDFDGTLIFNDTTTLISQAGLDYQIQQGRHPPPWQHFSDVYIKELQSHHPTPKPSQKETSDLPRQAETIPKLRDAILYQRSLAQIEEGSARRVLASALTDFPPDVLKRAASTAVRDGLVKFRDGALQLLAQFRHASIPPQILSLNWSVTWVRVCLETAATDLGLRDTAEAMSRLSIVANDIPPIRGSSERLHNSPFVQSLGIRTSGDKFQHIQGLLREAPPNTGQDLFIYIGDSAGDVEGLLAADVGFCIRDSPIRSGQEELKAMLEDCAGLEVERLHGRASSSDLASIASQHKKLYWAQSPAEILHWLEGLSYHPD